MRFTFDPEVCSIKAHAQLVRRRSTLRIPVWAWDILVLTDWA
jgi:hypothetical protein